ncbi:MAG: hypothetical protein ACRBN8_39705 [Nannocystales bacterium]
MLHKRVLLAVLAGFVACLVVGTLVAMAMGPFIAPRFGAHIRDPNTDGLLMPALLAGYAVVAAGLVWLQRIAPPAGVAIAVRRGLVLGLVVFVGDHLVTAGWSRLDALAMLVSGVADALAVAFAAWACHTVLGAQRVPA